MKTDKEIVESLHSMGLISDDMTLMACKATVFMYCFNQMIEANMISTGRYGITDKGLKLGRLLIDSGMSITKADAMFGLHMLDAQSGDVFDDIVKESFETLAEILSTISVEGIEGIVDEMQVMVENMSPDERERMQREFDEYQRKP